MSCTRMLYSKIIHLIDLSHKHRRSDFSIIHRKSYHRQVILIILVSPIKLFAKSDGSSSQTIILSYLRFPRWRLSNAQCRDSQWFIKVPSMYKVQVHEYLVWFYDSNVLCDWLSLVKELSKCHFSFCLFPLLMVHPLFFCSIL